jgi:hypothetical protein
VRWRGAAAESSAPPNPNLNPNVTGIAKLLGVSPGMLYNHIPDLRELRAAGRARATLPTPPRAISG